jgi:hypothetical protein
LGFDTDYVALVNFIYRGLLSYYGLLSRIHAAWALLIWLLRDHE